MNNTAIKSLTGTLAFGVDLRESGVPQNQSPTHSARIDGEWCTGWLTQDGFLAVPNGRRLQYGQQAVTLVPVHDATAYFIG